ncbi:MAG: hypothetical protein H8E47_02320 [Anaerolineales bacterium]|nr:hypothetical protein [Anaerolineales bacterium]
MTKKSRRAKKRSGTKRSMPAAARPKQSVAAPISTAEREAEAPAEGKAAKLAEEYRYVYSDLKRIAILAATMLAVLIILSFVIR